MPSFSRNLEQTLHRALALANERRHENATVEHLLLSLIDDPEAAARFPPTSIRCARL
jgi:ATP-dependent Clp protease ATP-binding subunit ClpA